MKEEHHAAGRMNGVCADGVCELVQHRSQAQAHREKNDDVPGVRESGRHPGAGKVSGNSGGSAGGNNLAPVGLSLVLEIKCIRVAVARMMQEVFHELIDLK